MDGLPTRLATFPFESSILTRMVRKPVQREKPHFLDEHLSSRPDWDQARLAHELETSETNVSRWVNDKRGLSRIWRRKIEVLWGLPINGLLMPPGDAIEQPTEAFLAGLSEASRKLLTQQRDHLLAVEANQGRSSRRK